MASWSWYGVVMVVVERGGFEGGGEVEVKIGGKGLHGVCRWHVE